MPPFTPVEGLVGGLLIGASVAGYTAINGRISGMSGQLSTAINNIVSLMTGNQNKPVETRPFFYVAGLLIAGLLLRVFASDFALNGATFGLFAARGNANFILGNPVILFCLSGFFTGIGTWLGSGCTSGHMLCGMARLSPRSIVATLTFCGVAFVLVQLLNTPMVADAYFKDVQPTYFGSNAFIAWPHMYTVIGLIVLLLLVAAGYTAIAIVARREKEKHGNSHSLDRSGIAHFSAFFNALVFGLGLGLSGMTLPQKVLGFFAIGSQYYDPSLFMVVLGALLPNLLLFQGLFIPAANRHEAPLLSHQYHCIKPSSWSEVNLKLILGAAFFGIGWGIAGVCPGPAIVTMFTRLEMLLWFSGYFVGLKSAMQVEKYM